MKCQHTLIIGTDFALESLSLVGSNDLVQMLCRYSGLQCERMDTLGESR